MTDASGQLRLTTAPQQVVTDVSAGLVSGLTPSPDSSTMGVSPTPDATSKPPQKKSPKDFIFGKVIGEGSFSTVYLAKDIHIGKEYAIKVCEKRHILREKKAEYVKREKEVLNLLASSPRSSAPFFVKLSCTFQDANRLYFVLSYAKNGEFLSHINKVGSLDVPCTQFYSAEVLHALEHLHSLGIIHRDLKPENILLNEDMHILITDFGSAKVLPPNYTEDEEEASETDSENEMEGLFNSRSSDEELAEVRRMSRRMRKRKNSFVGTAQYVSPELLTDKAASRSSDLWALGCLIYQMVAGLPPFRSRSEYLIFQKIMKLEYGFPDGFSPLAKDLVERLLVTDPKQRLGAQDLLVGKDCYSSIRRHPFYHDVEFETLHLQSPPKIHPFLPETSEHAELRSDYSVPDHLEPGLDDRQLRRLLCLDLQDAAPVAAAAPVVPASPPPATPMKKKSTAGIATTRADIAELLWGGPEETADDVEALRRRKMEAQLVDGKWNSFVQGNLILKKGLLDKKKGLFARRRMFMLTLGPHLYYVDPVAMVLKGEIPWSPELRVEPKNFKIFFVHTPNRTYYLEDPEGYALEWCKAIEDVWKYTYGVMPPSSEMCSSNPSKSGAS